MENNRMMKHAATGHAVDRTIREMETTMVYRDTAGDGARRWYVRALTDPERVPPGATLITRVEYDWETGMALVREMEDLGGGT
jgi:hypothetical protein